MAKQLQDMQQKPPGTPGDPNIMFLDIIHRLVLV
jgi:hypothetical protein